MAKLVVERQKGYNCKEKLKNLECMVIETKSGQSVLPFLFLLVQACKQDNWLAWLQLSNPNRNSQKTTDTWQSHSFEFGHRT